MVTLEDGRRVLNKDNEEKKKKKGIKIGWKLTKKILILLAAIVLIIFVYSKFVIPKYH